MALSDWTFTPGQNFEREFDKLRRQMDDVFGKFGIGAGAGFPAMNIYDQGEHILVAIQAPGVIKEDLSVELRDNTLLVSGSRKPAQYPEAVILRDECAYGEFKRSVRIPMRVRQDKIEGNLKNGILMVKLPKSDEAPSQRVEISV